MTAWRNMLQSALVMIFFTGIFTALMAGIYFLTQEIVMHNEEQTKLVLLEQVLPKGSYDNNLLRTTIRLPKAQSQALGNDEQTLIYQAQQAGETTYIIVQTTAPDGYGGKIQLLIGINRQGVVQAVRVLAHKETPGLGDYIELGKSDWILQFNGKSLNHPSINQWQAKKDGGQFDAMSGATITARAIIKAVQRALLFTAQHHELLFTAR